MWDCGVRGVWKQVKEEGDCSRCFRFLPGFELSVVELRFGRDVRREVGIDGENIKLYL